MKRWLLLSSFWLLAASGAAQVPATASAADAPADTDPIRCWWRSSAGAIRTGETFEVSLTCAMLDTDSVQVVVDESRLGASVVQMPPFEVAGGSHPADIRANGQRFFQYHYTLRIINPDAIGKDVPLPPTALHYRVNSRVAQGAAVQGRDLVYALPPQSVRVASMVPGSATDIRDSSGEDFGAVESLRLRANVFEIAALTSAALGVLMTLLAFVSVVRRARGRAPVGERQMTTRELVGAAARELTRVREAREAQGWNEALAERALAATRLTAAAAIGGPISQHVSAAGDASVAGRLVVSGGLRAKAHSLSSPTTARDLDRARAMRPAREHAHIEELRDALAALSAALYGRDGSFDETRLDRALASAISASGSVRAEHGWAKTLQRSFRFGAVQEGSRA